ncbi:hypothetical protein GCM10010313_38010 [Streptomyces violarus]|uniref:Uncharacterized protein n=1 Tax=Streptomyces violarus TaxID=67380 RepID=A0A7W4ZZI6_9ACTN|nr:MULTISPECIES: hypothetical protein [Streptomyces]MBB3081276.1 hypothetical protein [Streptomyces violarus]WRU00377.1 hypothetical protein VJ737_23035 [Streptomyces sp. CGMCC 4.1772]GHD13316.1 hypothetical protein GCM10010313_38010 [Streptomyces violarus]
MTGLPCRAPASVRIEGYSARDGVTHGSLDVIVHACSEHAGQARTERLNGFTPYTTAPTAGARCGDRLSFADTPATPDAHHDADLMRVDAPQVTPLSVAHLMDTPLPQLVDELGVTLTESAITDPGFTGYVYADRHGATVALPPARPELEHDCVARYLIGRAFNVADLPPLPEPFQVTDMTDDFQREQTARRNDREGRGSW